MRVTYIELETAKLAKEKGFDQQPYRANDLGCMAYYPEYNDGSGKIRLLGALFNLEHAIVMAPTQDILQQWLREEHNLEVVIKPCKNMSGSLKSYVIAIFKFDFGTSDTFINIVKELGRHSSYEKALESGLIHALKLIK